MITQIGLDNFKCFTQLKLDLGKITLLTGKNSSGKSSILQSLAILNQTIIANEWSKSILLNGMNVSLGSARDVINQSLYGEKNKLKISIETDGDIELAWELQAKDVDVYELLIKNS